jgi:hypothetical protein
MCPSKLTDRDYEEGDDDDDGGWAESVTSLVPLLCGIVSRSLSQDSASCGVSRCSCKRCFSFSKGTGFKSRPGDRLS